MEDDALRSSSSLSRCLVSRDYTLIVCGRTVHQITNLPYELLEPEQIVDLCRTCFEIERDVRRQPTDEPLDISSCLNPGSICSHLDGEGNYVGMVSLKARPYLLKLDGLRYNGVSRPFLVLSKLEHLT